MKGPPAVTLDHPLENSTAADAAHCAGAAGHTQQGTAQQDTAGHSTAGHDTPGAGEAAGWDRGPVSLVRAAAI